MDAGKSKQVGQLIVGEYVRLEDDDLESKSPEMTTGVMSERVVQVEVDPEFIGIKASSNKHFEGFIPVPKKTRVIRLAKEVKLLIKKVKQSKVVQKLKHLVRGKMKRAIKGENWIPIPETRLNAIVEKLSPQVQEEMKEKLQEFNAMLHDLDDKKQEIHRLETNCLKTEVEFSEAMDMVVATSKGKSIPHKKGLVVAFPASRDGQQKIYYQLNAGSIAGNIRDANIIREKFEAHPVYEDYLRDRKAIKAIKIKRKQIKKDVENLVKEIQRMHRDDVENRIKTEKTSTAYRATDIKVSKEAELNNKTMEEAMQLRRDISDSELEVFGLETKMAELDKEIDCLNGQMKVVRDRLASLNTSITVLENARDIVPGEDFKKEIDDKLLNEWYSRIDELDRDIQSHEADLEAKHLERRDIRIRLYEEKKVLCEMETIKEAIFDKVNSDYDKVVKQMDKDLEAERKRYKRSKKKEVSDVKQSVNGKNAAKRVAKTEQDLDDFGMRPFDQVLKEMKVASDFKKLNKPPEADQPDLIDLRTDQERFSDFSDKAKQNVVKSKKGKK